MTPPDRLSRLEQLRLLMRQGVDPTRAMVVELLDEVERRAPLVGDEITWREEARSLQLHFDDCLAENERLAAARDALADELAELRQQLNDAYERGRHEGETDEREACARVALDGYPLPLEAWAGTMKEHGAALARAIAAAIRARGATASSQPAEPLSCTCADGPPKFEPPKPLEFDGEYLLRNAAAWFTAGTGKCTRCGGAVTRGDSKAPGAAEAATTSLAGFSAAVLKQHRDLVGSALALVRSRRRCALRSHTHMLEMRDELYDEESGRPVFYVWTRPSASGRSWDSRAYDAAQVGPPPWATASNGDAGK